MLVSYIGVRQEGGRHNHIQIYTHNADAIEAHSGGREAVKEGHKLLWTIGSNLGINVTHLLNNIRKNRYFATMILNLLFWDRQ